MKMVLTLILSLLIFSQAANGEARIVCLGDSIVEGSHVEPGESWCDLLGGINLGVSGNTSRDILERIDQVKAAKPTTLVIAVGWNDAYEVDGAPQVSVEEYVYNLNQFVTTFKPRRIILVTPNASSIRGGYNRRVRPYVEAVRTLATRKHIRLADTYAATSEAHAEDRQIWNDDIHLNRDGHALVYPVIRSAVLSSASKGGR